MLSTKQPPVKVTSKRSVPGQHLYIIQSSVTGAVKIGRSSSPEKRLLELQTGSPYRLRLLAIYEYKGDAESRLHKLVEKFRLKINGEWFHPDCLPNLPEWVYEKLPFEDWWWNSGSGS